MGNTDRNTSGYTSPQATSFRLDACAASNTASAREWSKKPEAVMLSLAELMLETYGYTVLTGTSGQEVLHMFEIWPDLKIDVAVIDVVMPVMDGFELVVRMRKIRPRLPILYMSAYPEKAELRPEQTRNIPFVPKPFTSLTLVGKIREALDTLRSQASGQG